MRIGLSTLEMGSGETEVSRYVMALTRAMLSRDEAPELVLFVLEEDAPRFEYASRRAELVPVPEQFRHPEAEAEWREQLLPDLARHHDVDLVHLSGYRKLQWRDRLPLVATVHDPAPLLQDGKKDWETGFFERVVKRKPQARPPAFIATNNLAANSLEEHLGLPRDSVAVIYNGIDPRFRPGQPFEAKTRMDELYDLKEPFFLNVGPLNHPIGNHTGLIAAFNRFKRRVRSPWLLMLVGSDGPDAATIHAAVKQSPYAADIRVVERVTDADLPTLFQAADAFVQPSLEARPDLTLVQAMACGCPVISTTRGLLGEWVGEASSLIDPDDMDDFSGKLAAMAGSLELRQRWRKAGLVQAKKFDWDRAAIDTMTVYERLAPGR